MNFNKKNRGEYRYYIENEEDISKNELRSWLYNTFCVSNALANSQSIKDRIILEYVPSGQEYLQTIIEAMKENYSVWTTSYFCSWCSSCSRLWVERSKVFFTETSEMISEETDKECNIAKLGSQLSEDNIVFPTIENISHSNLFIDT